MAITSSGTITFTNITDEHGGGNTNISLGEYYRDPEGVVSGNNTNVPSGGNSGPISMTDFYSTVFKAYVTYNVIGGGGGGGGGAASGAVSGNPRGATGGSSTLTGSGFSNVSVSGGQGGRSGHSSYAGSGGNTAGAASPLTGGGGGAKGSWSGGAGGDASAAGAGGGGASGTNASYPNDDGYGGQGGSAGSQTTGSQYMEPATLTLTAGAGGAGYDAHADGGDGDHGYVSVTVRAPNTDGTWNNTKQSATQNAAGSSTLAVADTAYTG